MANGLPADVQKHRRLAAKQGRVEPFRSDIADQQANTTQPRNKAVDKDHATEGRSVSGRD
ncbi:hypothetical protein VV869_05630 [Photobacterium sp. MCCC 1A19761]|uniref:hypothetical protein n=1 Tax=Photobacterium sp. MCCC 1A19761 TaxID=3115000 RepID=UPI00307DB2B0